jgi:hypothetical protein
MADGPGTLARRGLDWIARLVEDALAVARP